MHQDTHIARFDHAIVIGGSLMGLLAGRVLSEYFSEVTVIERDLLNEHTMQRPGVPQSRHLHALLPRGLRIIEAFFPGIREELESYGAVPLDIGGDVAWLTPQGWGANFQSGLEGLSFTRDLLDWAIRSRISDLANVRLVDATDVTGLLRGKTGRIFGVRTCKRKLERNVSVEEVRGDLVVMAAGRQNAVAEWFADIGLEQPKVTIINAHIGYASRMYKRPDQWPHPWKAYIVQAAPPDINRSGLMFPVEGDRWLVTLIGADRDHPPNNDAGFLEFARSLRDPGLYEAMRDSVPLTSICAYRATENRQHHFDQLKNWPEGLIVMGDAACAFNPVYGQGMSTAAIEASRLHSLLCENSGRSDFCRDFQQEVARIIQSPWTLATSADLRFRSVEGATANWMTGAMHWYVDQVLRLGTSNEWARRRFLEVQGMLRDASALLKRDMIWRVLVNLVRNRSSHTADHRFASSSTGAHAKEDRAWLQRLLAGQPDSGRTNDMAAD